MEITDKHIEQFLAAAHQTGERRLTRCSSGNLSWRIGEFALISATGSWLPELQAGQISICRVATSIEIPCYCGREIAIVPYYRPGSAELAKAVSEALLNHDAALLEKHGQVYAGKDLKSTIEKAEFLEMACEIMIHSGMNYNPLTLPEIEELEQYLRGKHR